MVSCYFQCTVRANVLIITLLIGESLFTRCADAQDISHWTELTGKDIWRKRRQNLIVQCKTDLFDILTTQEAKAYRKITFVDSREFDFLEMPRAAIKNGKPIITFPTAYVLYLDSLISAKLVEERLRKDHFTLAYARYCGETIRLAKRRSITLEHPFQRAKLTQEQADTLLDSDGQMQYQTMMLFMGAFVIAHEVGHHVLGHLGADQAKKPATERELEADRWACQLLSAKSVSPYFGAYVLDFEFGIRSVSDDKWKTTTHPHAVTRMLQVVELAMHQNNRVIGLSKYAKSIKDRWKNEFVKLNNLVRNVEKDK